MNGPNYFGKAAEALQLAMKAATLDEQGRMLEEALRLNKLALAEEHAKLAAIPYSTAWRRHPDRTTSAIRKVGGRSAIGGGRGAPARAGVGDIGVPQQTPLPLKAHQISGCAGQAAIEAKPDEGAVGKSNRRHGSGRRSPDDVFNPLDGSSQVLRRANGDLKRDEADAKHGRRQQADRRVQAEPQARQLQLAWPPHEADP